jgi:bacillithiol biosynthesis cysteine-adding enzyme BshC
LEDFLIKKRFPANKMRKIKIPINEVSQLSLSDKAYATGSHKLTPFYKYPVSIESFKHVIKDKSEHTYPRELIVNVLREQYEGLDLSETTQNHINSIKHSNTFTILTAHQPVLFTGPLYYIFKICSTLNLCKQLKAVYPDYHFVPLFINGAEDHDFEEINHTFLYHKRLSWNQNKGGSVGKLQTETLENVLNELKILLGDAKEAMEIYAMIHRAYTENELYEKASSALVNAIFGKYGLVILNMSHPALKQYFSPVIEKELFENPSQPIIEKTQHELGELGYSIQAHAREINLFYLRENERNRIEKKGDHFQIVGTNILFTKEQLREELANFPERFSPNVVLRPLFQEYILPNLAYIGGGGEVAYWLERKAQFEYFNVPYPMLIRRNSALIVEEIWEKKWHKLDFSTEELFLEPDVLIREFIKRHAGKELSFDNELAEFSKLVEQIKLKAIKVDPTLEKTIIAEGLKQLKSWEQIATRLTRAEKTRHDVQIQQIKSIKEKLFPGNGLQERQDNIIPYFIKYGVGIIDLLIDELNPLAEGFLVLCLNDEDCCRG